MKCHYVGIAGIAAIAVFLLLGSAGTLFAGVVMAETSLAEGPDGQISSQKKTIYVQGNKQKVDRGGVAEITDLDKNVIYIIDKHNRVYTQVPLAVLRSARSDKTEEGVVLRKTGAVRIIADHPCGEYSTVEGSALERVTITACVSKNAPGAKELSQFNRNMIARLTGHRFVPSAQDDRTLMLEKRSVLSFRLRDTSRRQAYRTASLVAKTQINKIKVQDLPPETFEPPEGYNKAHSPLQRTNPPDSDHASRPFAPEPTSAFLLSEST